MARYVHDDVLDAALNVIKTNADKQVICSQQPTTYAEAATTYMLAEVAMTGTDYTIADGDTTGRKITVGTKTGASVTNSGTGTHVALIDTVGSRLLFVTTMTSQALTASNPITFNSWTDTIADPTAP